MEVITDLGRVSLVPRGAYDAAAVYRRLDIVEYEGSGYLVLADGVSGVEPAEGASYMLLAGRGGPGPQGEQGKPGPQGEPGRDGTSFTVLGRYGTLEACRGLRGRRALQERTGKASHRAARRDRSWRRRPPRTMTPIGSIRRRAAPP